MTEDLHFMPRNRPAVTAPLKPLSNRLCLRREDQEMSSEDTTGVFGVLLDVDDKACRWLACSFNGDKCTSKGLIASSLMPNHNDQKGMNWTLVHKEYTGTD